MIDYISQILIELGYISDNQSFAVEAGNQPFKIFIKDKSAYVVISIQENMKFLLKEFLTSCQSKLFESVLQNNKYKDEIKKNSYLLILVENKIAYEYQRKFFINIEEDPFFFKKYVLRYNDEDLKSLTEKTSPTKLATSLGQLAIDHNVFNRFSEANKNRIGYENLLYQLYVKIPALSLPTASKDIGNLLGEIQNKITADSLKEQNDKLWSVLQNIDENRIDLKLFKQIIGQL